MKLKLVCLFSFYFFSLLQAQETTEYKVYALKISGSGYNFSSAAEVAVGASETDSVQACNMFWLLQGENGKNILVDVGYDGTTNTNNIKYISPLDALLKLDITPEDISDIIITHPHVDHIGEIDKFPDATVWMQKADFSYFVGDAWQEGGKRIGFKKEDVRKLIEINLDGRLKLVEGDSIEFLPGIRAFTGSKHTFENQYLLVKSISSHRDILLASDAIWFYYNLEHYLPATLTYDPEAYVEAMKRIETLIDDPRYIIPGHDDLVFSMFPEVKEWIVEIE